MLNLSLFLPSFFAGCCKFGFEKEGGGIER